MSKQKLATSFIKIIQKENFSPPSTVPFHENPAFTALLMENNSYNEYMARKSMRTKKKSNL